jgi:hypothetical protein
MDNDSPAPSQVTSGGNSAANYPMAGSQHEAQRHQYDIDVQKKMRFSFSAMRA